MKATVWRATLVFFLVVSAILGMSTLGASQTITDLGVLGPGPYSWAWGVNLQGQAVGYSWAGSTGPIYPVRWERNGAITALDNVGGTALAINNLGEAVGYQSPGYNRGVLWKNGTRTVLDFPDDVFETPVTFAYEINDQGQIMGHFYDYPDSINTTRTLYWENENGSPAVTDIGDLGGVKTYATDMNELGQIVGYSTTSDGDSHAFIWEKNSGITDIDPTGDCDYSIAKDINNIGQVIIESACGGQYLWEDGVWTPIVISGIGIRLDFINDLGQVIGTHAVDSGGQAFLWEKGVAVDIGPLTGLKSFNNFGQLSGSGSGQCINGDNVSGPWVWDKWTGVTCLDILEGGGTAFPQQISDSGFVAGGEYLAPGDNVNRHAVLWAVPLPPQTGQDQLQAIVDNVTELVDSTDLTDGEGNALTASLAAGVNALTGGNDRAACNAISAFIRQVEAKVRSGKISEAEGQELILLASSIADCQEQ